MFVKTTIYQRVTLSAASLCLKGSEYMKRQFLLIFFLLAWLVLTACSRPDEGEVLPILMSEEVVVVTTFPPSTTPTLVPTASATATAVPLPTETETATAVPPTATLEPTATASNTPEPQPLSPEMYATKLEELVNSGNDPLVASLKQFNILLEIIGGDDRTCPLTREFYTLDDLIEITCEAPETWQCTDYTEEVTKVQNTPHELRIEQNCHENGGTLQIGLQPEGEELFTPLVILTIIE